jgi:poly(3-hydroxyoctanoate) depolymerase
VSKPGDRVGTGRGSERFARFWGLRIFTREQGDGVPLLMIMGLGGNTEMWGPTEQALANGSRTIVFDAPGTGRSSTSPIPLVQPLNARFVSRLLDDLGHDQVDVLGYSLGGVTAQQFAKHFPHRVRRMALVATVSGWGSAPPDVVAATWLTSPLRPGLRGHHAHHRRVRTTPRC